MPAESRSQFAHSFWGTFFALTAFGLLVACVLVWSARSGLLTGFVWSVVLGPSSSALPATVEAAASREVPQRRQALQAIRDQRRLDNEVPLVLGPISAKQFGGDRACIAGRIANRVENGWAHTAKPCRARGD